MRGDTGGEQERWVGMRGEGGDEGKR